MSSGWDYFQVPGTGLGPYMDYVILIPWHGCYIHNGDDKAPKAQTEVAQLITDEVRACTLR